MDLQNLSDEELHDMGIKLQNERDALNEKLIKLSQEKDRRFHVKRAQQMVSAMNPAEVEAIRLALQGGPSGELGKI